MLNPFQQDIFSAIETNNVEQLLELLRLYQMAKQPDQVAIKLGVYDKKTLICSVITAMV